MAMQFEKEAVERVLKRWVKTKSETLGTDLSSYITDDDTNDLAIELVDAHNDALASSTGTIRRK